MRKLLLVLMVAASPHVAGARTTVTEYLAIDQSLGPAPDAKAPWAAASERVRSCPRPRDGMEAYVRCLLAALNEVRPDGDGKLSTLMTEGRGDPFSIAAAVLLLEGRRDRLEAVVFGSHVLLAVRGDRTRYFDPKQGGREMTIGRTFATYGLPFSRAEHADVDGFLAYYAGRLAVASSSEPLFRIAVRTAGRSGRLRYDYGAWLLRQNRLDEARKELGKATRLDPDHFDAWLDRGSVQAQLGRLRPAKRSFVQALRVDPRSTTAKEHLKTIDARIEAEGPEQ
jgi:tetratricopeptide (TPR) repeat protein